jgi:hypothetical protein
MQSHNHSKAPTKGGRHRSKSVEAKLVEASRGVSLSGIRVVLLNEEVVKVVPSKGWQERRAVSRNTNVVAIGKIGRLRREWAKALKALNEDREPEGSAAKVNRVPRARSLKAAPRVGKKHGQEKDTPRLKTIRTIDMTAGDVTNSITAVFQSNVDDARKENSRIIGAPDVAPRK